MRDSHDPIECNERFVSDCLTFPFTCATTPCPEAVQQPIYCVSISLTPEDLGEFEDLAVELKNTYKDCGYSLMSHEEIGELPRKAMARYRSAVNKLEKRSARRCVDGENPVDVLERYVKYADGIRAARRSPSSVGDPASGISKSVDDIEDVSKRPGAETKKQRRSKDARRGIIEEALDYKKEHPSMTNNQITDEFELERGALSKPKVQKLIEQRLLQEQQQREKEDRRQKRTVSQDVGNDLRYEHFDRARQ